MDEALPCLGVLSTSPRGFSRLGSLPVFCPTRFFCRSRESKKESYYNLNPLVPTVNNQSQYSLSIFLNKLKATSRFFQIKAIRMGKIPTIQFSILIRKRIITLELLEF